MNFGEAVQSLKEGERVARSGWNGKNMYLFLITDWDFVTDIECEEINDGEGNRYFEIDDFELEQFICLKSANNKLVPWNPNNLDMLAEDWIVL